MKMCSVEKIRNFAIVGHAGAGKTSLAELMLFKAGAIQKLGSVTAGNTVSDFRSEEQERKTSVYASSLHCTWRDHWFFFTDTPGYADFCGEVCSATEAADMSLIVVDAVNGIGPGTIRAWQMAEEDDVPRAFFINGLDKEGAHYQDIIGELQDAYGRLRVIPVTLPVGTKADFKSVVNVFNTTPDEIPADLVEAANHDRQMLLDTIAETDEALMEKYLSGDPLSEEEIARGLHKAIVESRIIPVFVGSVAKDIGVTELMNGVINFFPSMYDAHPFHLPNGEVTRTCEDTEGIAWVYKHINDPFLGQMSYLRVISGTWTGNTEVYNTSNGYSERLGHLHLVNGKTLTEVETAYPGSLIAVNKLKNTHLGNTLCLKANSERKVGAIHYPKATMIQSFRAANKTDDEKVSALISRYCQEDPTLRLERHQETAEELLHGMGDQHFAVIKMRLKHESKVDVLFSTPRVPYRETIAGSASASYRHKKQTGGHGQFAEVHLRVEPCAAGYEFANEVVGGNIPKNYIPAVEKGVLEAMNNGPLAHCKVINVRVAVYDGKEHPVDSSEMAFKIASSIAFKDAMQKAKPILLEPIMKIKVYFPESDMGAITGDLNTRRARIMGIGNASGFQTIEAEIPLAEVFSYSSSLRSLTQGRGYFEMEPHTYETVPAIVVQKVQKEAAELWAKAHGQEE